METGNQLLLTQPINREWVRQFFDKKKIKQNTEASLKIFLHLKNDCWNFSQRCGADPLEAKKIVIDAFVKFWIMRHEFTPNEMSITSRIITTIQTESMASLNAKKPRRDLKTILLDGGKFQKKEIDEALALKKELERLWQN